MPRILCRLRTAKNFGVTFAFLCNFISHLSLPWLNFSDSKTPKLHTNPGKNLIAPLRMYF